MAALSQTFDPKAANLFNVGMPTLVLQNGTNIPESGYAFDAATAQQIFIVLGADFYLSGNLTVSLDWYSDAGNVVGDVLWGVQIAALSSGDAQSVLTDALATAQTNASTVNGTARGLRTGTVTVTNLDSLAVDDRIQMRIYRDAAAGGDTMAGNAILTKIKVAYASTAGAGAGNVSNAGGAGDNDICRFDFITGQVIQDSPVNLDDSGNLTGVGNVNELTPRFIGYSRLASAFVSVGTALQDVTGTSIAFPSAGTYAYEFELLLRNSDTTNTIGTAVNAVGGTISGYALNSTKNTNITTQSGGCGTTNNTVVNTTVHSTSTIDLPARLCGTFVATAAGTVVARLQKNVSGTVTAQIGSYGKLYKIS